jgi:hypothetical protein
VLILVTLYVIAALYIGLVALILMFFRGAYGTDSE